MFKKLLISMSVIFMVLLACACTPLNVGQNIIKDAVGDQGGSASFSNDSTTITNEDGEKLTIGTNWPDNQYTRLIPKPSFGTVTSSWSADESFFAILGNVTLNQAKSYVSQLEAAGFNNDKYTMDGAAYGTDMYTFTAKNAAGNEVAAAYSSGSLTITIG